MFSICDPKHILKATAPLGNCSDWNVVVCCCDDNTKSKALQLRQYEFGSSLAEPASAYHTRYNDEWKAEHTAPLLSAEIL